MPRGRKAAVAPVAPPLQPGELPPYLDALTEFTSADQRYHTLEENLLTGMFFDDIEDMKPDVQRREYRELVQKVREALEERNARLKALQDLLRQQVTLSVTKWRGPDGAPTELSAGPFRVSSVTFRNFDPKSLFNLTKKHGLLERLMDLKTLDKDGKEVHLVQQTYEIDFKNVLAWLRANKLEDVVNGAYDEKEGTPQVKGPKPLTFLGDEVKK